ncbi:regulatory protein [Marinimicrobium koreense]|uniref:Regulatory protein RecX n=1 Tax=Marinimicrobium koreense TaxID=306545 RepID=A0A3N1P196_9GAMM|nr:regulatory protein RecX [Marinimicrobium koreense]ROQ20480.1 regulatory protein [Marinimicrobium koreense]
MTERDESSEPTMGEVRLTAMNLLARREHARDELRTKLLKRFGSEGERVKTVDQALARLEEQGLQSDERFTEAFVTARERQGKGPLRIAQELRQKGVSDSLVSLYLDEGDERWWDLANEVRRKRFGDAPVEAPKEKARQARFLQYRGFSHEQVREAIANAPRHP